MINTVREFPLLLQNRLTDILFQEASNSRYMYLYYADQYWTAFERSAFQLWRIKLSLSPYPIVVASVREKELHKVVKGLACKKCSVKERIYVAQNITNPISYNHWHEEETRGLRTILDQLHLY